MLQKVSTFFPRKVLKKFNLFFVLQELLDDASDPLSTWLDTKVQHFNIYTNSNCVRGQNIFSQHIFFQLWHSMCRVVSGKENILDSK